MKAAELLVRCLENEGVQVVFGLPGEETLELMDALLDSRIRFIETRHEGIDFKVFERIGVPRSYPRWFHRRKLSFRPIKRLRR